MNLLNTFFPFIRWFPIITKKTLRADLVAGITVALILVPQSMAYASLAGLPVVYGLYASFIPVIVASMWGSSNQLHTGPVAMLSLMSAAAIMPLATPGTSDFIQLSIMLAVMVGVLRMALGIFKLGAIVNLLSSPVIIGFTNAAALIIGLSQLSKIIGVPFPRSDSYLADLWRVIAQIPEIHWWTLLFAAGAWVLIDGLKRFKPTIPGVLIAVGITTLISALVGFEIKTTVTTDQIKNTEIVETIQTYAKTQERISILTENIADNNRMAQELENLSGLDNVKRANELRAQVAVHKYELDELKPSFNQQRVDLHSIILTSNTQNDILNLYSTKDLPANIETDGQTWRISKVSENDITLSAGGAVVGDIPQGLPSMAVPEMRWDLLLALFPAALVMALIGFMEATSISKAIATTTGERVDTSKELVGQGLANIAGSFFGSYTVSGSFSRSAVAAKTGAKTGLFAIISALAVVSVLLFFTPYLYHLPQAVLAVIVMMAVFSLIRIKPLILAWKIDRVGASIGIITFVATLLMAPSIANGILLGVLLTILHFLIGVMKPRVEVISRKDDGTLGGMLSHQLTPISKEFVPVRFDGSLTFVNVAYFEDAILEAHSEFPEAKTILIIGSGINSIDVSGEEKIREIANSLHDVGVDMAFSGLKFQVMKTMIKSGLVDYFGKEAFFPDKETAINSLCDTLACLDKRLVASTDEK